MADDSQILMEISFNLIYLVFIWFFVGLMTKTKQKIDTDHKEIAFRFLLAFFLLALGDTGHVGFRVMAYINGGLDLNATLVGLGALSTSITITFFYLSLFFSSNTLVNDFNESFHIIYLHNMSRVRYNH